MSKHVMLDLETLGTKPGSVIIAIGAVKFDPHVLQNDVSDSFHVRIDPASCQAFGLTLDAKTIEWWMDDARQAARAALHGHEKLDLPTALDTFISWLDGDDYRIWGNGATFDNVLLRAAYEAVGMDAPWSHRHDRCYRTIRNIPNAVNLELPELIPHYALHDAVYQAKTLQAILDQHDIVID